MIPTIRDLQNFLKGTSLFLFIFPLFVFMSGCSDESQDELELARQYLEEFLAQVDQTKLAEDLAIIDDSLSAWDLTGQVSQEPFGTRYIIHESGNGKMPELNSRIRMKYSGRLLTADEPFDSNESLELIIYQLIAGFQTTLPLLPEGTKVSLYIPSVYGYGEADYKDQQGQVIIPGRSNLVFEVELLKVL